MIVLGQSTFLQELAEEVRGEGAADEVAREPQGPHQVDGGGRRRQVVGQIGLHGPCTLGIRYRASKVPYNTHTC